MADKRDYYEVLGCARDASAQDLKKAYRKLAMQFHPDRNPGDAEAEARFKEAAEAYEVLGNDEKRARYDRFGHQGVQGSAGFSNTDDIFSAFGDMFADLFGFGGGGRSRGGRGGARAGNDLRYDLTISFEEAIRGVTKELNIRRSAECSACDGSGGKAGTEPVACRTCQGRGEVVQQQAFLQVRTTCPACRGAGRSYAEKCAACVGRGRVVQEAKKSTHIPPGVDTGVQLRIAGEGEGGSGGGPAGDLYVFLRVQPHEVFERHGDDIACFVDVPYAVAALGGTVVAPTLDGTKDLSIPPGTQAGDQHRLPGLGAPNVRAGVRADGTPKVRGDQILQVRIPVPKKLSDRQRELLAELAGLEGQTVQGPETSSFKKFFSKLKGAEE